MRCLIAAALFGLSSLAFAAEQNPVGFNALEAVRNEFNNGKFDSALRILDEADKAGEGNGRTLDLRGCILMEQGKLEEALQNFQTAAPQEPPNYARLHSGDALLRQHKWEEARAAYKLAQKETNIQTTNERLRFAVMMTYLGQKDDTRAHDALEQITFPTESASYYYAQAAWAFVHNSNREGQDWIKRAEGILPGKSAWFARILYEFGWVKDKPPLASE